MKNGSHGHLGNGGKTLLGINRVYIGYCIYWFLRVITLYHVGIDYRVYHPLVKGGKKGGLFSARDPPSQGAPHHFPMNHYL